MFEGLLKETKEARAEVQKLWREVEGGFRETSEKVKLTVSESFRKVKDEVARETEGFPFGKEAMKNIRDSLESNLGDALGDIINKTKSAKDAFKDMGEAFVQETDRIVTRRMAVQVVDLAFSGIGLLFGAAEGGVLPGHFEPITPMQHGGVYSRPTLGLIAEAGTPEAVVPLKRGGIPVEFKEKPQRGRPTYIVNAFSEEFMQQQINKALSQNAEVIVNMVQADIMAGGSTYQLIRGLR